MTRVKLRAPYISRAARGVPGQVLELEDAAARRLVSAGRATLADAPAAVDDEDQDASEPRRTKRAGGTTAIRSGRGRRAKAPTEDAFYNPDIEPEVFDPAHGRRARAD
ncbi:hypothetical protein [Streptomyces dysideae]|uniref:Uncharacterized protein n=1 Tax=Streptomyces dysideae TaxID=909626 RepID=A0A124IEX4_9ACTN|nr:hypothetical protein [Streptomyces dysideae]KUO19667.1 hypothetical protein AQJ91_17730 [Streptomyces dysideae]